MESRQVGILFKQIPRQARDDNVTVSILIAFRYDSVIQIVATTMQNTTLNDTLNVFVDEKDLYMVRKYQEADQADQEQP